MDNLTRGKANQPTSIILSGSSAPLRPSHSNPLANGWESFSDATKGSPWQFELEIQLQLEECLERETMETKTVSHSLIPNKMNCFTPLGKPIADDFYRDTEQHLLPFLAGNNYPTNVCDERYNKVVDHRSGQTYFNEEATLECEKQRRVKADHDQVVFCRKTIVYIGVIDVDVMTDSFIKELSAVDQWATRPQRHFATSVEQAYAHCGHQFNSGDDIVFANVFPKDILMEKSWSLVHVLGPDTYVGDIVKAID